MAALTQQFQPSPTHTLRKRAAAPAPAPATPPPPACATATTTTTHRRCVATLHVPQVPTSAAPLSSNVLRQTLDDPSLKSTWSHRAWVACGCTTIAFTLAKSMAMAAVSSSWLEPAGAGTLGYFVADLATGIYHWAIDNYGDASTPVFGSQIDAFQGHHKWPWTITRRQFANNLHALARATTITLLPLDLLPLDMGLEAFVSVCAGCIMFSQQFHAWAHTPKSRLSSIVIVLQDAGLLVSRSKHAAHHRTPYNNNYCIVSGVWNGALDEARFFEALEMVVFFRFGIRPRSWNEPGSDWKEEGDPDSSS
ncbi:hypothetical protein AMTRI_Chr02g214820 [Amborella trichopoda]